MGLERTSVMYVHGLLLRIIMNSYNFKMGQQQDQWIAGEDLNFTVEY